MTKQGSKVAAFAYWLLAQEKLFRPLTGLILSCWEAFQPPLLPAYTVGGASFDTDRPSMSFSYSELHGTSNRV